MLPSLEAAKQSSSDGLLKLLACEIRAVVLPQIVNNRPTNHNHVIDVIHRPVQANPAHSQIEACPPLGDARFKKLKEALARICEQYGWVVAPI